MAKGIRLTSDTDYSGTAAGEMPLIWDLAPGIASNLILLSRARVSKRSLIDLSASNATLAEKGVVTYTPIGVKGNNTTGLTTNIAEPLSFTAIVTMRLNMNADVTNTGELPGVSTLSNPAGSEQDRGTLLGLSVGTPAGGNTAVGGRVRVVIPGTPPLTTTRTLDIDLTEIIPVAQRTSRWFMLAVQLDAQNERIIYQQCGGAAPVVRQETAGLISGRPRANSLAVPSQFQIASTEMGNANPTGGAVEVAEVIVTNNVLAQSIINAQYLLTKAGLAANGITLA